MTLTDHTASLRSIGDDRLTTTIQPKTCGAAQCWTTRVKTSVM